MGSVVEGGREAELPPQLVLPLLAQAARCQNEDPARPALKPQLADDKGRLNGLAQAHLVAEQEPRRVGCGRRFHDPHVVRPRHHSGSGHSHVPARSHPGRVPKELEHDRLLLACPERHVRLQWLHELGWQLFGCQRDQSLPDCVGQLQREGSGVGSCPKPLEAFEFRSAVPAPGRLLPRSVQVHLLVVVHPALPALVGAAERDKGVACPVVKDGDLGMFQGPGPGPAVRPARHGHANLCKADGHHSG